LVAETATATKSPLQIPEKWSILKIVRTYFATEGRYETPAKIQNPERAQFDLLKNCQRTWKKHRLESILKENF
jgi:hypothetical protein